MVCQCACLALFAKSGPRSSRPGRHEQVVARERAQPLHPTCEEDAALPLKDSVHQMELKSPTAMARQLSSDSHKSKEQILSLDSCGSLVIVGCDSRSRSPDRQSSDEDGWRMQELLGNQVMAGASKSSRPARARKSDSNCEDGWRWEEMLGTASVSGTAATSHVDTARTPTAGRSSNTQLPDVLPVLPSPTTCQQKKGRRKQNRRRRGRSTSRKPKPCLVEQASVKAPEEDVESGWRWQEMFGTVEPDSPKPKTKPVKQQGKLHDLEETWRWQECNFSTCTVASFGASAAASTAASTGTPTPTEAINTAVSEPADAVPASATMTIASQSGSASPGALQAGDIVQLGAGAPVEYRDCPAAVLQVYASHCTVVVLDADQRFGIGECWPNFEDVLLESCTLRLGTRVVIDGMRGKRTQGFNGHTGTISRHPREGHPVLIRKPSNPDIPQLTVCVCFDNPQETGEKSALIEPRFLLRYDETVRRYTECLGEVVASLTANIDM